MNDAPVGEAGLAVRAAVRTMLTSGDCEPHVRAGVLGVGLSGGADSLALADAAAHCCARLGMSTRALIVDHGIQDGSSEVAEVAAEHARALGIDEVRVLTVDVGSAGGPEAAARSARYAAFREAMPEEGTLVLLGHTLDDQAETVLLGLGRGSGPRSVAGMRPLDPPWARPLLDLPRSVTERACAERGLRPWQDPHNTDPRFARVRLRREVLPALEDVLQGGVAAALGRTATQLREDLSALDELAAELYARTRREADTEHACTAHHQDELDVGPLSSAQPALRRRVIRHWLLEAGARNLSDGHLRTIDALIADWHGQGGTWLPGNLVVSRTRGRLRVYRATAEA